MVLGATLESWASTPNSLRCSADPIPCVQAGPSCAARAQAGGTETWINSSKSWTLPGCRQGQTRQDVGSWGSQSDDPGTLASGVPAKG